MKQIVNLKGSLVYKPEIGERMVIIQGENPEYFTSKVVAIRKRRLHSIEVETTNTIYRITYEKRKKAKKAA
ncbi:MAG: hypothetical protein KIG65_01010 [Eubacteriales bacterium]|nr:hypothetical protein [Eubacteriales bacterium]